MEPFIGTDARRRSSDDPLGPLTPEMRYARKVVKDYGGAPNLVLPTPLEVEDKRSEGDTMVVSNLWKIVALDDVRTEAQRLAGEIPGYLVRLLKIPKK